MRRPGPLRRGLVAAAAATLTIGLAGCGDSGTAADGGTTRTSEASTASDDTLTRENFVQTVYDAALEAGSAHTTMKMTGGARMSAEGDVSYEGGTPSMQMTMNMGASSGGRTQMRLTDGIFYMQIPGMTQPGKFMAIDPQDKNSPMAGQFDGLTGQMDPLQSIKAMQASLKDLELVGEEEVDGEPTDRYRLTVDSAALLKQMKAPAAATPELPKTLTYDMWLDEDDLIRKMKFDLSGAKFEMMMSKWGEPVSIEKPAARDVMKMPGS